MSAFSSVASIVPPAGFKRKHKEEEEEEQDDVPKKKKQKVEEIKRVIVTPELFPSVFESSDDDETDSEDEEEDEPEIDKTDDKEIKIAAKKKEKKEEKKEKPKKPRLSEKQRHLKAFARHQDGLAKSRAVLHKLHYEKLSSDAHNKLWKRVCAPISEDSGEEKVDRKALEARVAAAKKCAYCDNTSPIGLFVLHKRGSVTVDFVGIDPSTSLPHMHDKTEPMCGPCASLFVSRCLYDSPHSRGVMCLYRPKDKHYPQFQGCDVIEPIIDCSGMFFSVCVFLCVFLCVFFISFF